jgi:streptomycin 6-kinase
MISFGEALTHWHLSEISPVADTPGSIIARAILPDSLAVVLKLLKPRGMGEMAGMDYLDWRDGRGVIRLIARHENACLLEDAGLRTLEQLRASDGEAAAADVFIDVVSALHSPSPRGFPASLVPLERHFSALLDGAVAVPDEHSHNVAWATEIARSLLSEQTSVIALHGDLHHENILCNDRGEWRAIDPHGLIGDPAYDLANVFGNPLGRPDITCDPKRIQMLAGRMSDKLGYPRDKLLSYAAAHAALSACWSLEDPHSDADRQDADDRLSFLSIVRTLLEV